MTKHSLTLGSLLLTKSPAEDVHGYKFNVLADGVGFGVAQGVVEVVRSLLADGDLSRITRYGNREVTFKVQITGPTLAAVAHGEAALRREIGKTNTLTWQAPDILSAPTVFEVVTSEMVQNFDDLDEVRRSRTFTLTLTCAPFARSASATTVSALATGTTTVTIDTCDSEVGWTGTRNGAPTTTEGPWAGWEAGSIGVMEVSDTQGFPPETWTMTRTGSVDFTATPYLSVEMTTLSAKGGAPLSVSAHLDGGAALPILEARRIEDSSGYFRVTFDTGAVTAGSITFKHTSTEGYGHAWQGLQVRNVARTDIAPNVTARQLTRILDVGGTERTPGSLKIAAPDGTSALQLALVATWPETGSGFSPPLRRWRAGGNAETVDANTFSGKREPMGPSYVYFDVPVGSLPQGTYQLMALMRASAAGSYAVESVIQSRYGGVTLGETLWGAGGTEVVTFPLANDWLLVPMGVYGVPIVAAKAGEFRVHIKTPSSTAVEFDEAWLFPVDDDCALSAVLTDEPYLWLDSADPETRVPKMWEGSDSAKADARWPRGMYTMGHHVFTPGRTAVFTATFGVDWAEVELTYFKRWHSNAAED